MEFFVEINIFYLLPTHKKVYVMLNKIFLPWPYLWYINSVKHMHRSKNHIVTQFNKNIFYLNKEVISLHEN